MLSKVFGYLLPECSVNTGKNNSGSGTIRGGWSTIEYLRRSLRKRFRMLPAGGLGVSPSIKKSPKIGG